MTVTQLPRPAEGGGHDTRPARWAPTRAGILNIWRYYDEVFEFHHGRLLLRGPNGSGKSKALELLLPFLFDANLRANRLSTFGTGERTMHWNLMGEGASGTTRVGYVWLEFRLPGEPGRWFTCGARLQASTHTTTVHPDYFTTELRVGEGILLVTESGQPLTKNALQERLGEQGVVHASATDYRTAVRSTLFPALGEQRFDALITALLQLRTPKLSQRLDPSLLSTLLSRALPPLGQQEIAELAEGFERLDAQRERLTALENEVAATRVLAARQRTYAQRVLRAAAARVVSATTELDNLTRTARVSAERYEVVAEQKTLKQRRSETLERQLSEADARRAGLTESEEYKKGQELDRLREQVGDAAARATRLRGDADRLRDDAMGDKNRLSEAERAERRQESAVLAQETDARRAADRAGLASVHSELSTLAELPPARRLLRAALNGKRDQLLLVGQALEAHDRAVERRERADTELEEARAAFSDARDQLDAHTEHRESVRNDLGTRLVAWATRCRELVFPAPETLLVHLDSEAAVLAEVDDVAALALHDIIRQETVLEATLSTSSRERDGLASELGRLSTAAEIPPAAPPTRTTDRTTMAGAPLWRLVDFAGSVPEHAYAGIEAALEGSGLLDAWLGPRGEIEGHDVFADVRALTPVAGRSLADVLIAEDEGVVGPAVVGQLLAAVAFDDRLPPGPPAAVAADGAWRMGALTGSWRKDQPAYIGSLARQRARERRIEELRYLIADADTAIAVLEAELARLISRREVLRSERAARPGHGELVAATQRLNQAEADLRATDTAVRQRADAVSAREQEVRATLHALTTVAAENGLPTTRAALETLAAAIADFGDQADLWLDEQDKLRSARRATGDLATQAERSAVNAGHRADEAAEAEVRHRQLAATLEAVDNSYGMSYREVLAEISELRRTLQELREERRATDQEVTTLAEELGKLDARRSTDAGDRDKAAAHRDTAAHRFRLLATGVLPADSGIEDLATFRSILATSDGVSAALDAARLVTSAWPAIPYAPNNLGDALHRLSESVHACRSTLSARADLDLETDEDVQIFTAVVDGVRVGAAELLKILADEAEQSRDEITDRERRLFDQTLTGDTRRHLAARIRQANELVDGMNARLERVRTASNVAVQIVWQIAPDLPPGTRAARDLLLKDPVRLSEADRDSLHQFFRDRIEQAKADDTSTSWEQQLAQVFDYTAWHRFVVKIDRANGSGWQLLTKKLHGALSGGEKAIVLHLPLFAAVAAHYQAVPDAPRVIMLDEVFVGVDAANRGQVFALLSALDLDLMLTSDHEWCTYPELSGVGIHQLITGDDGDDAVTTARFTWNGEVLQPSRPA